MTPRIFAIEAHGDQRYNDEPYSVHLQAVHDVLVEFGVNDADLLASAWLHDVLEDTSASRVDIYGFFGKRVLDIVRGVTDEPGKNRKERKRLTYPKIAANPDCVTVKMADRIANMRACATERTAEKVRIFAMYQREYPDFRHALIMHGGLRPMWDELDRLYTEVNF